MATLLFVNQLPIHGFTCTHRGVTDNSNLEVIAALFRYCQIFSLLLAEIYTLALISALSALYNMAASCQERKPLLRCPALLTAKRPRFIRTPALC